MDFNSVLSWLKGEQPTQVTLAPPLQNYPTPMDADYARQYGFGYGSGNEPYLDNKQARVIGDTVKGKFQPQKITSYPQDVMLAPSISQNVPLTGDLRGILDNTYMRAALAANRSPVASIGFDPNHFGIDAVSGPLTTAGGYDAKTDMAFTGVAPDDSLVHESTHRGIQKLREKYPEETKKALLGSPSEEMIVRYLMQTQAGDPERTAGEWTEQQFGNSMDLKQQRNARELFTDPMFGKNRQQSLNDLQELAIRYRKDMHPGGPR